MWRLCKYSCDQRCLFTAKIISYIYFILPQIFLLFIQPLNFSVFILHQLLLHFWRTKTLPFWILAIGLEKFEGFLNKILFSKGIIEFIFFNCDQCIHPLLFFKSIILLQFSFLSICLIGKLIFLYINLIGDSKLGPYLTFTLFFFKDKKISSAFTTVKKKREKNYY